VASDGSPGWGRWDVGANNNAVTLERISESDERLFDDSLAPEEARELAGLLTKYADKLEHSDKSEESGKSAKSDEAKDSDKSDESEDSDKSSD
jgi:hypothetical protein